MSHPLLDALTDGGHGVAAFWPFSDTRHFLPWRPLPVAPIGAAFLMARGLDAVRGELATCAPLLVMALWPAGRRTSAAPQDRPRG